MWMCVTWENGLFSILPFDFLQLGSHVSQVVAELIRLFITGFIYFFPFFTKKQLKTCVKGGLRWLEALLRSICQLPFAVFTWVTQSPALVLVRVCRLHRDTAPSPHRPKEREVCAAPVWNNLYIKKNFADGLSGIAAWETSVALLRLSSNHCNNYDNDD